MTIIHVNPANPGSNRMMVHPKFCNISTTKDTAYLSVVRSNTPIMMTIVKIVPIPVRSAGDPASMTVGNVKKTLT